MNEALSHRDRAIYHTRNSSIEKAIQTLVNYPWEQWAMCSILHTESYDANLKVDQLPEVDESIFVKIAAKPVSQPTSMKTALKTKVSKTKSPRKSSNIDDEVVE
jgi:hypothetical protein